MLTIVIALCFEREFGYLLQVLSGKRFIAVNKKFERIFNILKLCLENFKYVHA